MPTLNDFDKNDEDSGGLDQGYSPAQSAAVGSATGGPKQATPEKQQEPAYVPWSSFVNANADVSKREAGKLAGQVQGDVNTAQGDLSKAQSGFNGTTDSNYNQPAAPAPATAQVDPSAFAQPAPARGREGAVKTAPTSSGEDQAAKLPAGYTPTSASGEAFKATAPAAAPAQPGNPWASFLGASAPAGEPGKPQMQAPALNPLAGYARSQQLTPGAVENGAKGPQDLEQSAGQSAWNSLLGDTTKAQGEVNALGSETGVQGLLQSQASGPIGATPVSSAFDAALINGQGGPQFQALNKQFGGNQLGQNVINAEQASQDKWKQLTGDVSTAQAFKGARDQAGADQSARDAATNAAADKGRADAAAQAAAESSGAGTAHVTSPISGLGPQPTDPNAVVSIEGQNPDGSYNPADVTFYSGLSPAQKTFLAGNSKTGQPPGIQLTAALKAQLQGMSKDELKKWFNDHGIY